MSTTNNKYSMDNKGVDALIKEIRDPASTDVLIRNLRAHAYSYAMDDAKLCADLRQAIGRLEHPSAVNP